MENNKGGVLKVKRETIAACMTCLLCNKLFRDATTISECLHTFCRKCIYKLLRDEEVECCPVCKIDLGCAPLEKLRPDRNLQYVRANIFPSKQRRIKAPEFIPSVKLPQRRKERSLSSLMVSTPRVSTPTAMPGRRSKVTGRKNLRGPNFTIEKPVKKNEDSLEDHPERSSSRETLNKFTQNIKQSSFTTEPSSDPSPHKETENGNEPWAGIVDLWKPLNYLVEVANRSKSSKFTSQGSTVVEETAIQDSTVITPEVAELKVAETSTSCHIQESTEVNIFELSTSARDPTPASSSEQSSTASECSSSSSSDSDYDSDPADHLLAGSRATQLTVSHQNVVLLVDNKRRFIYDEEDYDDLPFYGPHLPPFDVLYYYSNFLNLTQAKPTEFVFHFNFSDRSLRNFYRHNFIGHQSERSIPYPFSSTTFSAGASSSNSIQAHTSNSADHNLNCGTCFVHFTNFMGHQPEPEPKPEFELFHLAEGPNLTALSLDALREKEI